MKIMVSRKKFQEALALYGMATYDHLTDTDAHEHQWSLKVVTIAFTGHRVAFLECGDCQETKDHLNRLD